jgi:hypothetical protein
MVARRSFLVVAAFGFILSVAGGCADNDKGQRLEDAIYSTLRRDLCYNQATANCAIWIRELKGRRLVLVTVKTRDAQGNDQVIAQAAEGELLADTQRNELRLVLNRGEMSKDGGKTFATFEKETLILPMASK